MYFRSTSMYQIVLTLSAVMVFISSVEPSKNDAKQYMSELLERNLLERYQRNKRSMDDLNNFDMFPGPEDLDLSAFSNYDASLMQETLTELNHLRNVPVTLLPLGWKLAKRMLPTPQQMYTSGKDFFGYGVNAIKHMMSRSVGETNSPPGPTNPQESKNPPVTVISVTFPVVTNGAAQTVSIPTPVQTFQFSSRDTLSYPQNPVPSSSGPTTAGIPRQVTYEQISPNSKTPVPLSFDLLSPPPVTNPPTPVPESTYPPALKHADPSTYGQYVTIGSNSVPLGPIKSLPGPIESSPSGVPGTISSPPASVDPNVSSPNSLEPSIPFTSKPVLPDMNSPTSGTYSPPLLSLAQSSEVPLNPIQSTSATLPSTVLIARSPIPPIPAHTPFQISSLDSGTPSPALPYSDPLISPVSSLEIPLDTVSPLTSATFSPNLLNPVPSISTSSNRSPLPSAPLTPGTPLSTLSNSNPSNTVAPSLEVPFDSTPQNSATLLPNVLNADSPISHTSTYPSFTTSQVIPETLSSTILRSSLDPNPLTPPTLLNAAPQALSTPTHTSFRPTSLTADTQDLSNPESLSSGIPTSGIPVGPTSASPATFSTTSPNSAPPTTLAPTHVSFPTASFTPDTSSPSSSNSNPSAVPFSEVPLDTIPPNPATHAPVLINAAPAITPTPIHALDSSSSMMRIAPSTILSDQVSQSSPVIAEAVPAPPVAMTPDLFSPNFSEPVPLTPAEALPATLEIVTPAPPILESDPSVLMTPDSSSPNLSDTASLTPAVPLLTTLESVATTPLPSEPISSSPASVIPDSTLSMTPDLDPLTYATATPVPSESVLPPTPELPSTSQPSTIPVIPSPISLNPVTLSTNNIDSSLSSPVSSTLFESDSETGPQLDAPPMNDEIFNETSDDKINTLVERETLEDELAQPLTLDELIFHGKEHLKNKTKRPGSDVSNPISQFFKRCWIPIDEACNNPV